jgi:5'-nucleotidase
VKLRRSLAALVLVLACAPAPAKVAQRMAPQPTTVPAPPAAPPQAFVLSVLSLNDLHGRIGALPAFAGYVEALRRAHGDRGAVIAVDAGDMFQGTIASNQTEGRSVIQAYNALGLSAAALGNHEFDYGPSDGASAGDGLLPQGALRARIAEAKFPVLSANLLTTAGGDPLWTNLLPRAVVRAAGIKVGFVGVVTQHTPSIVMPDYFAGLTVGPISPAIEAQALALRAEGADLVVALAHAGADCKRFDDPHDLSSCDSEGSELFSAVRAVRPGLVDAWIGGHTHAGVAHFVNGVPVVEALSRGKAFGRIDFELSGSPPRVLRARPFPPEPLCPDTAELAPCPTHAYAGQNVEPSQAVAAVVAPALDICRHERERLLGVELSEQLPADHDSESALGNLFVDLMRAQVPGADAALANGGSLRMPLDAGPLSYGALYDTMPFDNRLVTIELTGKELRTVLETHFSHDAHGIISIAGLVARARCERGQLQVTLRRSSGAAIDDRERLSIVTSDYLATGGDRLLASIGDSRARIRNASALLLRDVLAEQLTKRNRRLNPLDVYDPQQPRLQLPSPRPVRCAN